MSTKINQAANIYAAENTGKRLKQVFFIACVAMLPALAMTSCKNEQTTAQTTKINQDSIATVQDTLLSQFNAARAQVDELSTEKSRLDSLITIKNDEISKLKKQAGTLSKKNRKLAVKLKKDNKFIESLKSELSDKARAYAEQLGILQSDRDYLTAAKDSLMKKYDELFALGSVLDASNMRLEALHLKHHGRKQKLTRKARKTDVLRVEFDIDQNRIATDGTKKIYLVMKDPSGQLLSNTENNSGTVTAHDGQRISYSAVKEIMLHRNEPVKDVTLDWKQTGDYKKGDYNIDLYNGGYLIGEGKVRLN